VANEDMVDKEEKKKEEEIPVEPSVEIGKSLDAELVS
jgi:hypothetical protein